MHIIDALLHTLPERHPRIIERHLGDRLADALGVVMGESLDQNDNEFTVDEIEDAAVILQALTELVEAARHSRRPGEGPN